MKKFILKLLIFCLLFVAVDRCLILLRNYVPQLEVDKRLEKVINKQIKSDILVFGSSRGARNILASQIADSLKQTAFNLSYPGGDIEFQNFVLKQVLKYHTPKLIILSMDDDSELKKSENILYRYDRLYPLVKYPVVRDELVRKGEKNPYLIDLFIFHQLNKSNFDLRKRKSTVEEKLLPCGSMPLLGQTKDFKKVYSDSIRNYNAKAEIPEKRVFFLEFIRLCELHHIELVIVFPPNFFRPSEGFSQRITLLAGKSPKLMHYDNTKKAYRDESYFNDRNHLKINGATEFTNEIIGFIKKDSLRGK